MEGSNTILLLGYTKIIRNEKELFINSKKLMELLVLLLINYKKLVVRDQLIEWLYPDYECKKGLDKAKNNLRKTVSRLNKIFGKRYIFSIPISDGGYILDFKEEYKVDILDFNKYISEGLKNNNKKSFEKAIDLYRGDLLENFRYVVDEVQNIRLMLNNEVKEIYNILKKDYELRNDKVSIFELNEKLNIKNKFP
jgi:DNA-binding SARP family transcriptional activator